MRPKERVRIDKPKRQKGTGVMTASWLEKMDDENEQLRCEACLTRPALGLLTLHDEDGHLVSSWFTCIQCAEHDAPIHDARGLVVAVVITEDCL